MSQPWQPASQPQPPQPDGGNPYAQSPGAGAGAPPPMPPQPPAGPPPGAPAGPPPGPPQGMPQGPPQGMPPQGVPPQGMPPQGFPGQPPAPPQFQGGPMPYPPQRTGSPGSPVGAFFLGLLVSFVISLIYVVVIFASYKSLTDEAAGYALYYGHALLNGAAVGAVAGLVGRRSNGAHVSAGIIGALGAFFGSTNAFVALYLDTPGSSPTFLLREMPFFPAQAWWGPDAGSGMLALLGLVLAAGAGWGIARLTGSRR
ncbi:hypothetical protein QIS99_19515 [Streptomyces sp. B-S-A8]|uniref:Uncharacterized protein n=1 Tax=Streptomyces solicavernae TaxID=3043614 RepID=A0ABT6RW19_9ACTN|nr:hypothetical protein [Streptomyces sp. B-S-A8]MDI3388374.1 hypothetical protein [Streptomyces sp. B-S-A8]